LFLLAGELNLLQPCTAFLDPVILLNFSILPTRFVIEPDFRHITPKKLLLYLKKLKHSQSMDVTEDIGDKNIFTGLKE